MKLNILQKFTLLSLLVTLVVAGALGVLVSTILSRDILAREARITAEALRTVTNVDSPPDAFARAVESRDTPFFANLWSHFQQMPDVIRLKIYDSKGTVVWSDDERLIGKSYADNEELIEALESGDVVVEMGKQKTEHEFERPLAPEEEILELYVPLISKTDGSVYSVLEIYKHPTSFLATRHHYLAILWAATASGGAVLFLSLYSLFRGALREQNRLYKIERQYAEVNFEMKAAGAIQRGLLPGKLPDPPGVSLAAYFSPCREIGGDWYDVFPLPDGALAVTVADSVGKGIPAALLMAQTQALLRAEIETSGEPGSAMTTANRSLESRVKPGLFATAFLGRIEPETKRLTYCNAGHCIGLLVRDGTIVALNKGGLPLGVEPDSDYEQGEVVLQSGDTVLLHSDGITEAINLQHEVFGTARLENLFQKASSCRDPEKILSTIRDAVDTFRDGAERSDDETMVCFVV